MTRPLLLQIQRQNNMHSIDQNNATILKNAMLNAGWPLASLPFALSQIALETGGFDITNTEPSQDNNWAGIKYNPSFNGDIATMGNQSPEGNHYAHYDSVNNFVTDFMRVLSLNKGSGKPIDQATMDDYATALHTNGYYTDSPTHYTGMLNSYYNAIASQFPDIFTIGAFAQAGDILLSVLPSNSDPVDTTTADIADTDVPDDPSMDVTPASPTVAPITGSNILLIVAFAIIIIGSFALIVNHYK